MVIEHLRFLVRPELRERFVRLDGEVWTDFLEERPGFIAKEVWIHPDRQDEVVTVIRWRSRADWEALPQSQLQAIRRQFVRRLGGEDTHELTASNVYQVRRFATT
jgi:uncharacterized protein (TIGR03792 family)